MPDDDNYNDDVDDNDDDDVYDKDDDDNGFGNRGDLDDTCLRDLSLGCCSSSQS